ncbi:MAG: peptidase M4 [Chromatiaceae bacterium]|nr:MAG: peptidase M4 [Chromatiaceae bacterium]
MSRLYPLQGLPTAALGLLLLSAPVLASERLDHDTVKTLREQGSILPMERVMAAAVAAQPGELVEVELERDNGVYRYEIKILAADGRLHRLELDAATAEVVRRRDRSQRD